MNGPGPGPGRRGPTRRQRKREQAELRERLDRGGHRTPLRTLRGPAAAWVYGGGLLWLGASIALVIAAGPVLADWAEAMPGGPAAFVALLGTGCALALLAACWGVLLLAHPGAARPGRAPRSRLIAATSGAGLLATLLAVALASALPARGGGDLRCSGREDLGCAVYADAVPELLTGLGVTVALLAAGSTLLYRHGPGRSERAPDPT